MKVKVGSIGFLSKEGFRGLMEMHLRYIGNATDETFGLLWGQFGICLGSPWAYEGDFGPLWDYFGHMTVAFGHFGIT